MVAECHSPHTYPLITCTRRLRVPPENTLLSAQTDTSSPKSAKNFLSFRTVIPSPFQNKNSSLPLPPPFPLPKRALSPPTHHPTSSSSFSPYYSTPCHSPSTYHIIHCIFSASPIPFPISIPHKRSTRSPSRNTPVSLVFRPAFCHISPFPVRPLFPLPAVPWLPNRYPLPSPPILSPTILSMPMISIKLLHPPCKMAHSLQKSIHPPAPQAPTLLQSFTPTDSTTMPIPSTRTIPLIP